MALSIAPNAGLNVDCLFRGHRFRPSGENMFDQIRRLQHRGHVVEFYETDDFLVESVRDFIAAALRDGDAAVIVATDEHRRRFRRALAEAGVDLAGAEQEGRFVILDAAETFARFMVDDMPRLDLFNEVIGGLISTVTATGRAVRVYGEMVAVLWAEGNVNAAIALEDLWNRLAETHRFGLLCAYPMHAFDGADTTANFRKMCDQHDAVIPGEDFSKLTDVDDQFRKVAELQQSARAAADTTALGLKQAQLERELHTLRDGEDGRWHERIEAAVAPPSVASSRVRGRVPDLIRRTLPKGGALPTDVWSRRDDWHSSR